MCLVTQSCLTLCNATDCSPPGSSAHGILQARILEWVTISSSRGSLQPRDRTCVSGISCIGRQILHYCTFTPNSASEIQFGTGAQRLSFQHQTFLGDTVGSVPHHCSKANHIKFLLSQHIEKLCLCYSSLKCAIALCIKKNIP